MWHINVLMLFYSIECNIRYGSRGGDLGMWDIEINIFISKYIIPSTVIKPLGRGGAERNGGKNLLAHPKNIPIDQYWAVCQ